METWIAGWGIAAVRAVIVCGHGDSEAKSDVCQTGLEPWSRQPQTVLESMVHLAKPGRL